MSHLLLQTKLKLCSAFGKCVFEYTRKCSVIFIIFQFETFQKVVKKCLEETFFVEINSS